MRKLLIVLVLFSFCLFFSQKKSEVAFKEAIKFGYINSPYLIPIIVNGRFLLTDSETLYGATKAEINQSSKDSLKSWIFLHSTNQKFIFHNKEALKILNFELKKEINVQEINKIKRIIKSKHIIDGLKELDKENNENREIAARFYNQRFALAKEIKLSNPNFNSSEINFIDYLTTEFYSEQMDFESFGYKKDFSNSKQIFYLWKNEIQSKNSEFIKSKKQIEILKNKFLKKYFIRYKSNYVTALFDYGVLFYVSDLDGTTHYSGFAK